MRLKTVLINGATHVRAEVGDIIMDIPQQELLKRLPAVKKMRAEIEQLQQTKYLQLAEITRLRRLVESYTEGNDERI